MCIRDRYISCTGNGAVDPRYFCSGKCKRNIPDKANIWCCSPVSYTHLDVYKRQAVNFEEKDGEKALVSLEIQDTHTNEISVIPTELAVLAIGHSARDTFHMLHEKEIPMEAKSFAVGVRAEHLQTMIDLSLIHI